MSFVCSDDLPIHELNTVGVREAGRGQGWRLVVDAHGRPRGWLAPEATHGTLRAGGSLHRLGGPMRTALDAALSSPSGFGVVVDGEGAVAGGVRAEEVLAVWRRQRGVDVQ
jgi:osmoprotectant transport system ATP-binding protein